MSQNCVRVFVSYSRRDEILRKELEEHLAPLKREGAISSWHDRDISAGSDWRREIDKQLVEADLILLLLSSSFIDSEYCWEVEMDCALARHESGEARLVPIILRPCDWRATIIKKLQVLPRNGRAVTEQSNRDAAWTEIVTELRQHIDRWAGEEKPPSEPDHPEAVVDYLRRCDVVLTYLRENEPALHAVFAARLPEMPPDWEALEALETSARGNKVFLRWERGKQWFAERRDAWLGPSIALAIVATLLLGYLIRPTSPGAGERVPGPFGSQVRFVPSSFEGSRGFWVSESEVTQQQWYSFANTNPSLSPFCEDCPVNRLNYFEAVQLANYVSDMEGFEHCYLLGHCSGALGGGCAKDEFSCLGDYGCSAITLKGSSCKGYRLPEEAEWKRAVSERIAVTTWTRSVMASSGGDILYLKKEISPHMGFRRSSASRHERSAGVALRLVRSAD